jgi:pseudouridine kinase
MQKSMITVIGTVFMDCKGFAQTKYNPLGRNLGNIKFIHGGVGRNVAENLVRLGAPVAFASSVDATGAGQEIVDRLQTLGIVTDYIYQAPRLGMGMWLAVLDERGDLAGSISQMPDMAFLQELVDKRGEEFVQASTHLALELDLSEGISRKVIELARHHGKPVYGLPGNLDVVMNHRDLLRGLDGFICNEVEAAKLLGITLEASGTLLGSLDSTIDEMNIDGVKQYLLDQLHDRAATFAEEAGLRSLVVTLGSQGSIYYDAVAKESGYQPVFPVKLVDSTGAGDAFFSGTVAALVRGLPLSEAVICGSKVAGWTIESPENNCHNLRERMDCDEFFQQHMPLQQESR